MDDNFNINDFNINLFAKYDKFITNGSGDDKVDATDWQRIADILTITEVDLKDDKTKTEDSDEPFSIPELDDALDTEDIRITTEDLERIVAQLQAATDEKQIKRLQQELEDKKSQLSQQLGKKIEKIKEAVAKAKKAEKRSFLSKLFGVFGAIFSVIAAAAVTVFTGGVAAGFAIAGAVLAVANCVLDLTGGSEKIVKAIAKSLAKHHPEWGQTKCNAMAQAIFGGIMLGASLACLGGGIIGSMFQTTQVASKLMKTISMITKIVGLLTSAASTGVAISSSVANKESADAAAKVKEQQAYLLMIQKALEEISEDIQNILSGFSEVFTTMMNMINENTDNSNQIIRNTLGMV